MLIQVHEVFTPCVHLVIYITAHLRFCFRQLDRELSGHKTKLVVPPWLIIHTAVAAATPYSFAVTYYLNVQTVAAAAMLYSPYYLKIHKVVAAAMLHSSYLNKHTAVAAVMFHVRT